MIRYLIGFIVTVGLIILLIIMLFGGRGEPSKKVATSGKALDAYSTTDASVRLTIDGPINAAQDHRQVQITVDRYNAEVSQFTGYDKQVVQTDSFTNSEAGYSAFLHSLSLLGFNEGASPGSDKQSEAGHCATGRRYILELINNNKNVVRYWATSCGGPHTYQGNLQTTLYLFQHQIPNYDSLVNSSSL
ncbi:MAG: hypothetical protein ABIV43_01140 [Candidatus Saccharimonadales bacterium]